MVATEIMWQMGYTSFPSCTTRASSSPVWAVIFTGFHLPRAEKGTEENSVVKAGFVMFRTGFRMFVCRSRSELKRMSTIKPLQQDRLKRTVKRFVLKWTANSWFCTVDALYTHTLPYSYLHL